MSKIETSTNIFENKGFPEAMLPRTLNILTTLSIIWCCVSVLLTMIMPWFVNFMGNIMDKSISGEGLSSKKLEEIENSRMSLTLLKENLIPLLITSFIGITLCFVGAIMMRKLKKDGFIYYASGQILPFIMGLILLGMSQYNGIISYFFAAIPFIFIFFYWQQKKYLIK